MYLYFGDSIIMLHLKEKWNNEGNDWIIWTVILFLPAVNTFQMSGFRPEHRKNTHKFWWENKADPKLRDKAIVTEEETER